MVDRYVVTDATLRAGRERQRRNRERRWRWAVAAIIVIAAVVALAVIGSLIDAPRPPASTEQCPTSMPAGDWAECVAEQARRRTAARCDRLHSTRADQLEPHEWAQLARC